MSQRQTQRADRSLFREVHHLCVIVDDIDAAVSYYESIGVGPWRELNIPELENSTLSPEAMATLKYRVTDLDNVQLQLCEPGPGPTKQREFYENKGQGVYHIGFSVALQADAEVLAEANGLEVRARGSVGGGHGFAYYETEREAGVVLETRSAWNERSN